MGQKWRACPSPYLGMRFFGHFWANGAEYFVGAQKTIRLGGLFSSFDFLDHFWRENGRGHHAGPKKLDYWVDFLGQLLSRKKFSKFSTPPLNACKYPRCLTTNNYRACWNDKLTVTHRSWSVTGTLMPISTLVSTARDFLLFSATNASFIAAESMIGAWSISLGAWSISLGAWSISLAKLVVVMYVWIRLIEVN